MNRWLRGAIALGIGFGLTVAAIEIEQHTSGSAEPQGTPLGPLDMGRYCRREYGERSRAVHAGYGAYGWQCWTFTAGILTAEYLDADAACTHQYEGATYGRAVRIDDPNGWECIRGPRPTD